MTIRTSITYICATGTLGVENNLVIQKFYHLFLSQNSNFPSNVMALSLLIWLWSIHATIVTNINMYIYRQDWLIYFWSNTTINLAATLYPQCHFFYQFLCPWVFKFVCYWPLYLFLHLSIFHSSSKKATQRDLQIWVYNWIKLN